MAGAGNSDMTTFYVINMVEAAPGGELRFNDRSINICMAILYDHLNDG